MGRQVAVAFFALLLEALPQAAHGAAKVLDFPQATLIDNCYYKHARYWGNGETLLKFQKTTIYECQKQCVLNASWGCEFFGFYPASGACYLGGNDTVFTQYVANGSYAGPRVCPQRPSMCTEVPSANFPGDDETSSKLAWPSHKIPSKLECWPKDYEKRTFKSCPGVKVLQDTASGWPGRCLGLKKVVVPYGESCQSWCSKQVSCAVWQEVDATYPKPPECWQSFFSPGQECYTRALGNGSEAVTWKPKRSQRIQHGEIRVLKKLTHVEVKGLAQIFDENYFLDQTQAVEACRDSCYSDIACQWWYYNKATGCFTEDVNHLALDHGVMTTKNFQVNSTFAKYLQDGEYIQHICPSLGDEYLSSHEPIPTYSPSTTTTTTASTTTSTTTSGNETLPATVNTTSTSLVPLITPGNETGHADSEKAGMAESKGALAIVDVDCNKLSDTTKSSLGSVYAGLIARAIGVDKSRILNLQNQAGTTDIKCWTPNTAIFRRLSENGSTSIQGSTQADKYGVSAEFVAILDEPGQAGVSDALAAIEHPGFKRAVQEDTYSLLKDIPGAITSKSGMPGEPRVALMETPETAGLSPLGPTSGSAAAAAAETEIKSKDGSSKVEAEVTKSKSLANNAWVWVLGTLLVLGALALIAWIIWMICGSGNSSWSQKSRNSKVATKGGSYNQFKDDEDRPLFRGSASESDLEKAAPLISPNILSPPEPLLVPDLPLAGTSVGIPPRGARSVASAAPNFSVASGAPNYSDTSALAGVAAAQAYSSAMAQMQPQMATSSVGSPMAAEFVAYNAQSGVGGVRGVGGVGGVGGVRGVGGYGGVGGVRGVGGVGGVGGGGVGGVGGGGVGGVGGVGGGVGGAFAPGASSTVSSAAPVTFVTTAQPQPVYGASPVVAAPVAMGSPVVVNSQAAQFGLPTQFPQLKPMDLFDQIDTDGDGVISREEMAAAVSQISAARSQVQG